MKTSNFPIQFGWVQPPGARTTDKPRAYVKDEGSWMPPGPRFADRRARFDADMRRVINAISGQWSSVWVTDHTQWGEDDCLECMMTLSFYAALYPHLDFGTIVACQSYRNPALMAKMASTIQYLTKGRLILGIGAGWKVDEYLAYNYAFPAPGVRVAQLEETVQIFRAMWTQEKSSFEGKHYRIEDAINLPQTPQPPTLLIGGSGEQKMLPLIARYADYWNVTAQGEEWQRKFDILKGECDKIGRDFSTLRKTWFGGAAIGRTEEEVQGRLRDSFLREKGIYGTPEQFAAKIEDMIARGCTYFLLDTRGIPDDGEIELMLEVTKRFVD